MTINRMIDLDELEKLAKGATRGPWEYKAGLHTDGLIWVPTEGEMAIEFPHTNAIADTQFIAAANPETVLKLIEVAKAARNLLDGHDNIYDVTCKACGGVDSPTHGEILAQKLYELEEPLGIPKELERQEDANKLGDCKIKDCRGFTSQVNHSYCRACLAVIKEHEKKIEVLENSFKRLQRME